MAYDENGEWTDEAYGGGSPMEDNPYANDFSPRNDDGSLYTGGYDNADDHGKIKQPDAAPAPVPSGGGNRDYEGELKSKLGSLYTPGALEEVKHHDYDQGWMDRIVNKENLRANNDVGSTYHEDGKGGFLSGPKTAKSSALLGSVGSGGVGSGAGNSGGKMDDVYGYLKGLFPGGGFNQDIVNRRVDNARGALNTARNSTMKNNEAYLAEHGLAGSGPQAEAANSLDSRLFGQFGAAYNDIYANESENADKRMMGALTTAAGLSESEAQNVIDSFRANTERDLGFGNLALGNKRADNDFSLGNTQNNNSFILGSGNLAALNSRNTNDYNLGAGRLQLDREQLAEIIRSGDADRLQKYLDTLQRGAETSSNGHY